jgi:hypothetical protein
MGLEPRQPNSQRTPSSRTGLFVAPAGVLAWPFRVLLGGFRESTRVSTTGVQERCQRRPKTDPLCRAGSRADSSSGRNTKVRTRLAKRREPGPGYSIRASSEGVCSDAPRPFGGRRLCRRAGRCPWGSTAAGGHCCSRWSAAATACRRARRTPLGEQGGDLVMAGHFRTSVRGEREPYRFGQLCQHLVQPHDEVLGSTPTGQVDELDVAASPADQGADGRLAGAAGEQISLPATDAAALGGLGRPVVDQQRRRNKSGRALLRAATTLAQRPSGRSLLVSCLLRPPFAPL